MRTVLVSGDPGALRKVLRAGRAGTPRDAKRIGVLLVDALKLKLSQPGTGRVYRRGGVAHQASAPGEPPAVDYGTLRASIAADASRVADGAEVKVGSGVEWAVYTEFGTRYMAMRPWMRPVMAASTTMIRKEWADGIEGRERAMARRLGGKG